MLKTYETSTSQSVAKEFICGPVRTDPAPCWLEEAVDEVMAHLRYRLKDCSVADGQHPITNNELIGIIAKHAERSRFSPPKPSAYSGPIQIGDIFQWEPNSDEPAVVEVTKIDTDHGLVYSKLLVGEGPPGEVFNAETRFRKACIPVNPRK